LADIRSWKGSEVRTFLSAFSPDGMTGATFLLRENLPSLFHIPREEIVPLFIGSRRLPKSKEASREKEQAD
jgi:hypothetical protein